MQTEARSPSTPVLEATFDDTGTKPGIRVASSKTLAARRRQNVVAAGVWTVVTSLFSGKVSFSLFVLMPSILASVYFLVIATPQYAAQARLVVRTVDPGSGTGDKLSAALASVGAAVMPPQTSQNAYILADYIRSRAAVLDLLETIDLRRIYSNPDADILSRLKTDASIDDLYDYWKSVVVAYVDAPSGILTVEVRAFTPQDALDIANAVVGRSEILLNEMSERARADILRSSQEEVERARAAVQSALFALQQARDTDGLLDPIRLADDTAKLLMQLTIERLRIEAEMDFLKRSLDANSVSVRQLAAKLEILTAQTSELQSKLTNTGGLTDTVSAALRRFEELELRRIFAEKMLTFAEEGLERARVRAERQAQYAMTFVKPSLATKSTYPRRFEFSALIIVGLVVCWATLALFGAAINDHRV
jgi:capsular polysaccharide transport system permease protein